METQLALVNKITNRVENIIIIDNEETAGLWETDSVTAVVVKDSQTPYLHGIYDGKEFALPSNDYLIGIGLLNPTPLADNDGINLFNN